MRAAEIALCVLNLSDIIFLRTAPHTLVSEHVSQFWGLAFPSHSSCCYQQDTSHLAEDINSTYGKMCSF